MQPENQPKSNRYLCVKANITRSEADYNTGPVRPPSGASTHNNNKVSTHKYTLFMSTVDIFALTSSGLPAELLLHCSHTLWREKPVLTSSASLFIKHFNTNATVQ